MCVLMGAKVILDFCFACEICRRNAHTRVNDASTLSSSSKQKKILNSRLNKNEHRINQFQSNNEVLGKHSEALVYYILHRKQNGS